MKKFSELYWFDLLLFDDVYLHEVEAQGGEGRFSITVVRKSGTGSAKIIFPVFSSDSIDFFNQVKEKLIDMGVLVYDEKNNLILSKKLFRNR